MRQLSPELKRLVAPSEKILKLMWFGQFYALGIYVFIAFKMARSAVENGEASGQFLPIFGMMAIVVLVMSFIAQWLTLSPSTIVKVVNGNQSIFVRGLTAGSLSYIGRKPSQDILEKLNDQELKLYEYSGRLFSGITMQWGMVHTCALFGMILPTSAYQPVAAIVAAVLSAVCMFFHFPNIGSRFAAGLELADFEGTMSND